MNRITVELTPIVRKAGTDIGQITLWCYHVMEFDPPEPFETLGMGEASSLQDALARVLNVLSDQPAKSGASWEVP